MAGQTSDNLAHRTLAERGSDGELVMTRHFNAPIDLVFAAWTRSELFIRWWAPKSMGLTMLACQMDARTGGGYRIDYPSPGSDQPMSFFGTYLEVVPNQRLVWSNEESGDGPVTTVTFSQSGATTLVVLSERHPSSEASDQDAAGAETCLAESYSQLDELLGELLAS